MFFEGIHHSVINDEWTAFIWRFSSLLMNSKSFYTTIQPFTHIYALIAEVYEPKCRPALSKHIHTGARVVRSNLRVSILQKDNATCRLEELESKPTFP